LEIDSILYPSTGRGLMNSIDSCLRRNDKKKAGMTKERAGMTRRKQE